MKKHNILKIVLLSVLVAVLCTWIFPSTDFQNGLIVGERNQLGIFDLFAYVIEVIRNFPYVIMMVLVTGMFYGVAYRIPAYRILLDKLVKLFTGKETTFLVVAMLLISAIVSVTGLTLGIIFVFPFIISVVLLMGYNKLVAASVTVGSTIVGILGTTFGSGTNSYIDMVLGTTVQGEMISKIIIYIIALVILSYYVIRYANKTRNNTDKVLEFVPADIKVKAEKIEAKEKSVKVETTKETKQVTKKTPTTKKSSSKQKEVEEKKTTKKTSAKKSSKATSTKSTTKKSTSKTRANNAKVDPKIIVKPKKNIKIWPFILFFDLAIIILVISSFDWAGICNISIFDKALKAVQDFQIFGFPIFDKILGEVNAFGKWSIYYEIPIVILLITCFLGFIYGLKLDEFFDGIIDGIKKALEPMIYMLLLYLVLVISVYNPFTLNITKFLLDLTKEFNVIIMSFVAMISSIFSIENIYVARNTLPYVSTVITDGTIYPLMAIIFQSIYGLVMLIAPTSIILIGTLSYLNISYGQWIKHIWKLFLELLVVLVVIFLIIFMI